jgi:peptide/nickel transport system permease protein
MANFASRIPRGTLRFIGSRLFRSLISLLLFQVILFSLIQALPQDLVEIEIAVGSQFEAGLEEIKTAGPEESLQDQFVSWLKGFYGGDLGESKELREPIADILAQRLPRSLMLLLPGTVIGFLLGIWLGKFVAWQKRGWLEFVATLGGTAFYTSFPPWLAFVMFQVIGLSLGWFPVGKTIEPVKWFREDITINEVILKLFLTVGVAGLAYLLVTILTRKQVRSHPRLRTIGGVGIIILAVLPWITSVYGPLALDLLSHLVIPLGTLILLSFGETMLVMRATMVEAMEADFVPTARAKGLRDSQVRDRHVARVAILPVLARFILQLPFVIIGSFVLEKIFSWDGMGKILMDAAQINDLPILMAVLSVVGVGILLSHIILDLLNQWLDPRQRGIEGTEVAIEGER